MVRQSERDVGDSTYPSAASASRATLKARSGDTCVHHNGFRYTKSYQSQRKITFRCSVYRSVDPPCKAYLHVYPAGSREVANEHTCIPVHNESTNTIDVTTDMKQMVDTLSIMSLSKPVHKIWQEVSSKFYPNDGVVRKGLSENQVSSRVFRIRRKHYGSHLLGLVEVPPLSMVEGKLLSFFQFHVSHPKSDPTTKPHRIIGWAHPELRQLLMYHSVSIFIDGTFRSVPRGFKQCVILMVHDRASELYVPVYYVLCTGQTRDMYFDILELIFRNTSEKLVPSEIVCDFEHALIEATQKQFENALVIGCLFHWKQAIRRRMTKRHNIPENEVGIAMTKGVLDMLTVIDPELVPDKGIKWVKREIRMRCAATGISYSHPKWKAFWSYFRATWLERYNIEEWNVYGVQNELVARTNNPLERFHRELNRAFSPHPNIVTFVSTIRQISQDYVAKLADIATGRRNRGTTTNAKVRKRNSKRRGKNKRKKNKGRDIHDASSDEFEVPSPVDVQQLEGLSESESEDDAPSLEELESETSTDIEEDAAENAAEEGDFIPDFSFEYKVENESSETGIEDDTLIVTAVL